MISLFIFNVSFFPPLQLKESIDYDNLMLKIFSKAV